MPTINGGVCVVNGKPVDKVFSNGKQVYGRNLIYDTQNFKNLTSWEWGSSSWEKTTDTYKGLAVIQTNLDWDGLSQYIPVKKGDTFTYSVYARYTSGVGTSCIYWELNNLQEGKYNRATTDVIAYSVTGYSVTITDSWQRLSSTAIADSDGYIRPRIERTNNNTNTLQIAGIKVEKGSVATPWTPAPEDVGIIVQSA